MSHNSFQIIFNYFSRENWQRIKLYIISHKAVSVIIIIAIILSGYWGFSVLNNSSGNIEYTLAAVEKGTIISSVTGSGQVLAVSQVDIKPKVSGEITWLGIKADQKVSRGQALAKIDDTDMKQQIADAEFAFNEEKENYDTISTDAERTLVGAYEDGYDTVSSAFFKLPDYLKDLQEVIGNKDGKIETNIWAYKLLLGSDSLFINKLLSDYYAVLDLFNKSFASFRTTYRGDDRDIIYKIIGDTLETSKAMSSALESARHMLDAITVSSYKHIVVASTIDTTQPKIKSDISSANSDINSLQKIKDTIDDTNRDTPKKIVTAKNNLEKKERAFEDLKETLSYYTITAPFSGVIAKTDVEKYDSVSSNTTLATLITEQKTVKITLNEVDVAKIKVGQKATVTFDAIENLNITGKVSEIDSLGTVSQGVVTYSIKIDFDTQDDRVKPGMTASAAIITDIKQDVLMVSNNAIKFQGDMRYVEIQETTTSSALPRQQQIEVGISNDTDTEVISGLKEGDKVITKTTNTTVKTTQQAPSIISTVGTGGGGVMRNFAR